MHGLNDLWRWSGDLQRPMWTQIVEQQQRRRQQGGLYGASLSSIAWPPQWQAPQGWVSDVDGGELWLVGDSGQVQDVGMDSGSQAVMVRPFDIRLHV